MNYDPHNVIRVGTDLRFVDRSKPWDQVGRQAAIKYLIRKFANRSSVGIKIIRSMMGCRPRSIMERCHEPDVFRGLRLRTADIQSHEAVHFGMKKR